jgi:hypothetical protein
MVFVNPPWQSNDEDRHFFNAYNLSEGHVGPQEKDSVSGFMLPTKLYGTILSFQAIKFNENKLSHEKINDIENQELDLEKKEFVAAFLNKMGRAVSSAQDVSGNVFIGDAQRPMISGLRAGKNKEQNHELLETIQLEQKELTYFIDSQRNLISNFEQSRPISSKQKLVIPWWRESKSGHWRIYFQMAIWLM